MPTRIVGGKDLWEKIIKQLVGVEQELAWVQVEAEKETVMLNPGARIGLAPDRKVPGN